MAVVRSERTGDGISAPGQSSQAVAPARPVQPQPWTDRASRPPQRRPARGNRPCTLCGTAANALAAIPVAGAWVCARCFRQEANSASAPASQPDRDRGAAVGTSPSGDSIGHLTSPGAPPPPVLAHLLRIDRLHRGVVFASRVLLYIALAIWSASSPTGAAVFTGFLLADTLTWVAATCVDIRFHRVFVGLELALYLASAVSWLSLDRSWTLPGDASLQAAGWLTFALVAFVKIGWTLQRYVVREP